MNKACKLATWTLLIGLLGTGCGDDGGPGSGLDTSKQVSALTAGEVGQLQEEIKTIGEDADLKNTLCLYVGIAVASVAEISDPGVDHQSTCETERHTCLNEIDADDDGDDAEEFLQDAANCDVTVEVFLACIEDSINNIVNQVKDASCTDGLSDLPEYTTPASCDFTDSCQFLEDFSSDLEMVADPLNNN